MVLGFANQVCRFFVNKEPASTADVTFSSREAGDGAQNQIEEKHKHKHRHFGGSSNDRDRIHSIRDSPNRHDSIEKESDCRNPEVSNRCSKRRTMSRTKFEAVRASIALKARNEIEEKRNRAYSKSLGPLRIKFVDCESSNTDSELFVEEFGKFLDDDEKEQEKKERDWAHQWCHTFLEEKNSTKKKKKKAKKQAQEQQNAPSLSFSEQNNHLTIVRYLQRQYALFTKALPVSSVSSIFVRVPEHRLDLPRVLITGPHGTPYANGLFFFDCHMKDYPNSPPEVRFLTTGLGQVRFNPNLYHNGKVCLSLLGTWQGPGWIPGISTFLQVLLSCQGLVLGTDKPFYNEPGFEKNKEGNDYHRESDRYNKNIRKQTLRWGILDPLMMIVLQEERVDERKRYLEKLKKQRRRQEEEESRRMELDEDEDKGDGCSSSDSAYHPTLNALLGAAQRTIAAPKRRGRKN